MDINLSSLNNRQHFVDQFVIWAGEHCEPSESVSFQAFLRVYLQRFPLEEWMGRVYADLYGLCYALWLNLKSAPGKSPRASVYNPTLDEHGWQCGRTVIVILQRDMPFLVDTVRIALQGLDAPIHIIKSTVLNISREQNGLAVQSTLTNHPAPQPIAGASREALIYIEVSLHTIDAELHEIRDTLVSVLEDLAVVVEDHQAVLEKIDATSSGLVNMPATAYARQELQEFLGWLRHRHFAFLGYREYDLSDAAGELTLTENADARLGIFRRVGIQESRFTYSDFSEGMRNFYDRDEAICFSKASTRSSVHRSAYPDYVVIKKYDDDGKVCGEVRFLGLFTYDVYMMSVLDIPILRTKVQEIIDRTGVAPDSHDGKNLRRVIDNYPRDELVQSDTETLFNSVVAIANLNERHLVRLITRRDPFGNFVTFNVFVPKDIYSTVIRQKMQNYLSNVLGSSDFDFNTFFSESSLVRAQFIYRIDKDSCPAFDPQLLEADIVDMTRNWDDHLRSSLIEEMGETKGVSYYNTYKNAFTSGYQEDLDARAAVQDIKLLEQLEDEHDVVMNFYQPLGSDSRNIRFRVMHINTPIILSDIIPVLEHLGLRVLGERPHQITKKDNSCVWLHDFELSLGQNLTVDVHSVKALFEHAFEAVWRKEAESDGFNKLVLGARLHWREVCLLRGYAGYMKQTGFSEDQAFIAETLLNHADITRNLVALFKAMFEPRVNRESKSAEKIQERSERLKAKIVESLEQVSNLNEDRVLRRYLDFMLGTLRTNYFQLDRFAADPSQPKSYISYKFSPRTIADIPEPRPEFEIYVYSPRVEGVHLRGGKVARGGLRWSDRLQDYRTEVLGLVKAQQVKNAVIVPTGAKGGFVCKLPLLNPTREAFLEEGIACYKIFIQGLLDITDNLVEGKVVPPENVIRRDEDDPYLVVAADKGTATYSDIANEISLQYNHWLGDAFASGGSQGYDHKGMGITAKGAWVSVQRHFREQGVDIQHQDFTVIGIGDMAGDVFGNGMLLSRHIRLTAAFNHMHIFIDPQPDAASSFIERHRLFDTPRTNWADYNPALISEGGGVFLRSAKSISITPQMREAFAITAQKLTPTELISALLKAPVDLIWNGGIGTYVKSASESHAAVGDKANDGLRVNGKDLRCKVFGEGGNLGMTQLGRVEFCLNNGASNTDFIDNAAGVDCSDHEVNIKILLDELVAQGDLTGKQRNQLLLDMTDEVAALVLQNNYRQTQAISLAKFQASARSNEYRRFINYLENQGRLNRALEFIPTDEEIVERQGHGKSLTRPELSVLLSYAKVMLKEALTNSDIGEDETIATAIESAFPHTLATKFPQELYRHRLRREIVGTQVANDMINNLGITVAHRLLETTGASTVDIAKAYVVSREVFQFEAFQHYIKSLDNRVSSEFQAELMTNMIRRVRRGTRWFLRNRRMNLSPKDDIPRFTNGLELVYQSTREYAQGSAKEAWQQRSERYSEQGVPDEWALRLAMPDNLFSGLGVVESAHKADADLGLASQLFVQLLDRLDLNWFATQLSEVKVESYWQALARESFLDELEAQLRSLTVALIAYLEHNKGLDIDNLVSQWYSDHELLVHRWKQMVNEVQGAQVTDYAMFSVALRELVDLVQSTEHILLQV